MRRDVVEIYVHFYMVFASQFADPCNSWLPLDNIKESYFTVEWASSVLQMPTLRPILCHRPTFESNLLGHYCKPYIKSLSCHATWGYRHIHIHVVRFGQRVFQTLLYLNIHTGVTLQHTLVILSMINAKTSSRSMENFNLYIKNKYHHLTL